MAILLSKFSHGSSNFWQCNHGLDTPHDTGDSAVGRNNKCVKANLLYQTHDSTDNVCVETIFN